MRSSLCPSAMQASRYSSMDRPMDWATVLARSKAGPLSLKLRTMLMGDFLTDTGKMAFVASSRRPVTGDWRAVATDVDAVAIRRGRIGQKSQAPCMKVMRYLRNPTTYEFSRYSNLSDKIRASFVGSDQVGNLL
uniref:Uncharacterized protein n=1 Tax=Magnetospirillum gryphiswaldense TaxID=55518 RepID=Q3BK52_9PROT|nr:hypothetical protein mgI599 [Magnetospirillum gryphiswaldense MSR-1]CAM78102.1 hypothetical protein MGR_4170 [Magnetospirillum gryphiswaldense MSR-1]